MAKILAVANQKGGVGKTTTTVNLSAALTLLGKRVLLFDGDPQGNATTGMGVSKNTRPNAYDMMSGAESPEKCVVHTKFGDVIPSSKELAASSVELIDAESREYVLKNCLMKLYGDYDYIFIDCPPSLELLTVNALCAADQVLIPVQCEYYALEGLADLLYTLRAMKKRLKPSIDIYGLVLTMYDGRTNFSAQVAEEVRRHFPGKVFASVIPRNVRLSEAPSHGVPVFDYDRFSRGATAYQALADEILEKERERADAYR